MWALLFAETFIATLNKDKLVQPFLHLLVEVTVCGFKSENEWQTSENA